MLFHSTEVKSASHNAKIREDVDVMVMSFPCSFFTQNAPSRLRFYGSLKQKCLRAFLAFALVLVSLGALVVAMKTSEVVVVVIVMKAQ